MCMCVIIKEARGRECVCVNRECGRYASRDREREGERKTVCERMIFSLEWLDRE